ncbi:hypothetical protein AVEN_262425-1 [Araneus ventricosus]|uniref:Uncharacterized protein n=1 Tax=Araneus ventricosus TaxID=182803 RepID=A0A4Y2US25_ARAVE|nr:hypothetical protein AVEN_262425-1 [Araneus ventricosus]
MAVSKEVPHMREVSPKRDNDPSSERGDQSMTSLKSQMPYQRPVDEADGTGGPWPHSHLILMHLMGEDLAIVELSTVKPDRDS